MPAVTVGAGEPGSVRVLLLRATSRVATSTRGAGGELGNHELCYKNSCSIMAICFPLALIPRKALRYGSTTPCGCVSFAPLFMIATQLPENAWSLDATCKDLVSVIFIVVESGHYYNIITGIVYVLLSLVLGFDTVLPLFFIVLQRAGHSTPSMCAVRTYQSNVRRDHSARHTVGRLVDAVLAVGRRSGVQLDTESVRLGPTQRHRGWSARGRLRTWDWC